MKEKTLNEKRKDIIEYLLENVEDKIVVNTIIGMIKYQDKEAVSKLKEKFPVNKDKLQKWHGADIKLIIDKIFGEFN